MKLLFFSIAAITGAIVVFMGAVVFAENNTTAPKPQPLMLNKNWTPKQAWDLLTNIKVSASASIPYKGKIYECVVFGDQDMKYGIPKAIVQMCFDRITLKKLVKQDNTLSPDGPAA